MAASTSFVFKAGSFAEDSRAPITRSRTTWDGRCDIDDDHEDDGDDNDDDDDDNGDGDEPCASGKTRVRGAEDPYKKASL